MIGLSMSVTQRSDEPAFLALQRIGLCVGEILGSGAMSTVFAVSRSSSDATVPLALKLLHLEHVGHLELVLRFVNERHAAERVRHPGVVRVYESDLVQGRPYLVMERLSQTLAESKGTLSRSERVEVVSQIAHGAAALHAAGVVHRDLKPANIMLAPGRKRIAKIVDLGLAKLDSSGDALPVSTAAASVLGTAEYRAPEAWLSAKEIDRQADVYSLGVILYELVSGRLPFYAPKESHLMDLHLYESPSPLSNVPCSLWNLIERMLAKQRAQRPAMNEVAALLDSLQWQ